jgi:hypothetical protein
MFYKFNHFASVRNGSNGPLNQMQPLASLIDKDVMWGQSHHTDCIEAPHLLEDQLAFEEILDELKLSYENVPELPWQCATY